MDPLAWLFGLEQFGIKFGLENITTLVAALGHPERAFKSVHVAGTNGKGSVTAMVDTALRAAGHRSARYTSPHLLDLSERFVVNGRPVERDALVAVVSDVRAEIERLARAGELQTSPTFFEVTTAVAFELFRRDGVEIAVCEVGMGGRLDATNVLQPLATAITTIGFDHQQYLGSTLAAIAAEKAGIIKPGIPVVVGKLDPAAFEVAMSVARQRGAPVLAAAGAPAPIRLSEVRLALPGSHQVDNAAVAVQLLSLLDRNGISVPAEAIVAGLERVVWPGRLETRRLDGGREALLDAAHNPDGAASLAAFLQQAGERTRPLVFAAMRDKDVRGMLRVLLPAAGALIVTRASNPRSAEPSEIAAAARAIVPTLHVAITATPRDALATAWALSRRIVVAGSIFLLADVMKELDRS